MHVQLPRVLVRQTPLLVFLLSYGRLCACVRQQKNGDKIEHFGNNAGDKVSMYSWKDPASEIPWTPPSTIVLLRIGVQVARSLSSSCALPLHCSVSTPRCSLKCGETLTGKLVSDCHTAALWPGIEGSVMHGTFVAGSLGETWEALLHSVAPIECNERKVLKVWRARQAMAEGKKSKSFFDWLPWGSRRGAKENAETGISLDNRGCIVSDKRLKEAFFCLYVVDLIAKSAHRTIERCGGCFVCQHALREN